MRLTRTRLDAATADVVHLEYIEDAVSTSQIETQIKCIFEHALEVTSYESEWGSFSLNTALLRCEN